MPASPLEVPEGQHLSSGPLVPSSGGQAPRRVWSLFTIYTWALLSQRFPKGWLPFQGDNHENQLAPQTYFQMSFQDSPLGGHLTPLLSSYEYYFLKRFFFFRHAVKHEQSFSFWTRKSNLCPLQWKRRVLTSGLPGNSVNRQIIIFFFFLRNKEKSESKRMPNQPFSFFFSGKNLWWGSKDRCHRLAV